jgi:hypothetical protein
VKKSRNGLMPGRDAIAARVRLDEPNKLYSETSSWSHFRGFRLIVSNASARRRIYVRTQVSSTKSLREFLRPTYRALLLRSLQENWFDGPLSRSRTVESG